MNIEGLGASLVDQLIEQGLVRDFSDVYHLEASTLENLVVAPKDPKSDRAVPRKLGKVGRNVFEQIERSRANDLSRLIYALGIRHIGEKAAATIAPTRKATTAVSVTVTSVKRRDMECLAVHYKLLKRRLIEHLDAELACLLQLAAGVGSGDDRARLLAHRS